VLRILIVTAGSRGDVAPFTGLGQRLKQAGHQVALAAHAMFAELVQACDLELRVLPGDPVALTRARTAAPDPAAAHSVFADYLDRLGDGIVDAAAAGADLLITAFGPAPLSRAVAEGLAIPSIGAYLAPGFPTTAFPPPGLPNAGNLGPRGNLAAGREMFGRAAAMYAEVVHRLRASLSCSVAMPDGGRESDGWPIFHGFSPTVVPRPDDWPAHVRVSGYWWPAPPDGWQPAAEVADFVAAGPPPVFVGFGSMTPSDREELADIVAAAVGRARVRAIVQAGWAGVTPTADNILAVGDLPHDWLFPRAAAVVHHAGAGTTAAGLRAGVPAVAVPVLVDQPFWAARLHQLGAAPAPIPRSELSPGRLADALRACIDDPAYRARAKDLGDRIRDEDGCADLVEFVGRLCT
jgi:UDP:flavonoid glycosyltransferase YjiC (YdhE family)